MGLTARFFGLILSLIAIHAAHGQYRSSAEAFSESARTGKPILAISTSPTCPPCRALKQTLHTDPEVGQMLRDFVVLEMQSSSQEFTDFMRRFPGDYFGVPMVHVVSAEGQILYARSGGLGSSQLQQLLSYAIAHTQRQNQTVIASSRAAEYQETLESARLAASEGQLATALEQVIPIAALDEEARHVAIARAYREQLELAIGNWIDGLHEELTAQKSPHSAAYRLARLFTELPRQSAARLKAWTVMKSVEAEEATRIAMLQAKRLVRARLEEERKMCADAIRSYEEVARLDAGSPSGQYALNRIPELQKRQQLKLISLP